MPFDGITYQLTPADFIAWASTQPDAPYSFIRSNTCVMTQWHEALGVTIDPTNQQYRPGVSLNYGCWAQIVAYGSYDLGYEQTIHAALARARALV